jgi:hypothetical protein
VGDDVSHVDSLIANDWVADDFEEAHLRWAAVASTTRIRNRCSCLAALPRWMFRRSRSTAVQFGAITVLDLPLPLSSGSIGAIEVVAFGLAGEKEQLLIL